MSVNLRTLFLVQVQDSKNKRLEALIEDRQTI